MEVTFCLYIKKELFLLDRNAYYSYKLTILKLIYPLRILLYSNHQTHNIKLKIHSPIPKYPEGVSFQRITKRVRLEHAQIKAFPIKFTHIACEYVVHRVGQIVFRIQICQIKTYFRFCVVLCLHSRYLHVGYVMCGNGIG